MSRKRSFAVSSSMACTRKESPILIITHETDHHTVFRSCCSQAVTVARFQAVIKKARFVYSPYTATEM